MENVEKSFQRFGKMGVDGRKLYDSVMQHIVVILLAGVAAALGVALITQLFLKPQYESETKMYVLTKQSSGTLTNGDMEASTALAKDFAEMVTSRTVVEKVIAQLSMDEDYEILLQNVNVITSSDTRVITITVTDNDPYRAAQIADCLRDESAEHIQQVMNAETVNVVEKANIPDDKVSPSLMKNTFAGALGGIILALLIVLLMAVMDDTIKTSEDIEYYLNISALGVIPMIQTGNGGKKKKHAWIFFG